MYIADLIEELQKLHVKHGDIKVVLMDDGFVYEVFDIDLDYSRKVAIMMSGGNDNVQL